MLFWENPPFILNLLNLCFLSGSLKGEHPFLSLILFSTIALQGLLICRSGAFQQSRFGLSMLIVEFRIHGGMTQSDHQVTGFSAGQKTPFSGGRELSFSGVKFKVLYLDRGLDDTCVCICQNTVIVYLRLVHFIMCTLYIKRKNF